MWLEISLGNIPEQSTQEYMWTQERRKSMMTQKIAYWGTECDQDN